MVSEVLSASGVRLQVPEPATRFTVQVAPVLSFTTTDPVGTPVPATDGDTVTDTVTGVPNSAGFGDAAITSDVFSVKFKLTTCAAFCEGGPGSETATLKVNVPGIAVWPLTRDIVPKAGSIARNEGKPVPDHV